MTRMVCSPTIEVEDTKIKPVDPLLWTYATAANRYLLSKRQIGAQDTSTKAIRRGQCSGVAHTRTMLPYRKIC